MASLSRWAVVEVLDRASARVTPPPPPEVVKQDKSSGGSVDTTNTRSGPQRVRMSSGERPMGAVNGKQSDTEALCKPPLPPKARGMGQGSRGRAQEG